MAWWRRGIVYILSAILLVCLVAGAFAASAKINLSKPAKLETWLNQSNFYNGVVTSTLNQAQQAAGKDSALTISFNDDAVQQAAYTALSQQLVEQGTNAFFSGNYAWLEGKTSTPSFSIDLTTAQRTFAEQVFQAVQTRLSSLPVCTTAQLSQMQAGAINPLAAECRPAFINPQTEAITIEKELETNSTFLDHTTLTADTPTPYASNQHEPYYQQFAQLPKLYRLTMALPWICLAAGLLCIAGILAIATPRRKGAWRIGSALVLGGVILVVTKFFADHVFHAVENHIFNDTSVGQLQRALTTFFGTVEHHLVKVDLWFGIGYLIVGAALFAGLLITRNRRPKSSASGKPPSDFLHSDETSTAPAAPRPRPPRPPRLIQ